MKIKAGEKLLVLRFNNYKDYDFIEEHKRIIGTDGIVWILKLGKPVPDKTLNNILLGSAGLILKAPKSLGGKYYYCQMLDAQNMKPKDGMNYPAYYKELLEDMFWHSMDGTWIKVNEFIELNEEVISGLKLVSNDHRLDDVLSMTRTTMLYAYSERTIKIDGFGGGAE